LGCTARRKPWRDVDVELSFARGRTEYRYSWNLARFRYNRRLTILHGATDAGRPDLRTEHSPSDIDVIICAECDLGRLRRFVWREYWMDLEGRWRATGMHVEDLPKPPKPLYDMDDLETILYETP
jgi:hypothetical protein